MLTHSVIGPDEDGSYCVAHPIPGCAVMSATLMCRTKEQAQREATRLNDEQRRVEAQMKLEKEMRKLRLFHLLAVGRRGI